MIMENSLLQILLIPFRIFLVNLKNFFASNTYLVLGLNYREVP